MKNKNNYYEMLSELIGSAYDSAALLNDILDNFDKDNIHNYLKDMHSIENKADEQLHNFVNNLLKEFITPIDRNDLFDLASCIDDVIDYIDDILLNLYMYNISEITSEAKEFSNSFINSCAALKIAFAELPHFTKSKTYHEQLIEVNHIESQMDDVYVNSIRKLVTSNIISPVKQISWIKIYEKLEKCCDACETVSHILGSVAMRNA